MTRPTETTTVLIDGHCSLCHGWVQFLLPRDHNRVLLFGSQQSEAGRRLMDQRQQTEGGTKGKTEMATRAGSSRALLPVSIVVIEGEQFYEESTAALRALSRLGQPWAAIAKMGLSLPRWVRDPIYRFVARNRYRIFRTREHCQISVPGFENQFLPDD